MSKKWIFQGPSPEKKKEDKISRNHLLKSKSLRWKTISKFWIWLETGSTLNISKQSSAASWILTTKETSSWVSIFRDSMLVKLANNNWPGFWGTSPINKQRSGTQTQAQLTHLSKQQTLKRHLCSDCFLLPKKFLCSCRQPRTYQTWIVITERLGIGWLSMIMTLPQNSMVSYFTTWRPMMTVFPTSLEILDQRGGYKGWEPF